MFVMFGWTKEAKEVETSLKCYCYRCQRMRAWEHWKETEWISFFMVKTIPFLQKSHVVCSGCRESLRVDARRARQLGIAAELPHCVEFVESHQLAQKSDIQRRFLLAQREQGETRR